jgi:DNA-binding NarL/FixJ family response regulator
MFKSVLIAEDHQSSSIWVRQNLKSLGVEVVDYAYYCDDALLRIKRGIQDGKAYELLITDLSFSADDREQKLNDGTALIEAVKILQPDLKILVFSAEQQSSVVSSLFQKFAIDGYVRKGRRDAQDLKDAIDSILKNKRFVPTEFQQATRAKNAHNFTDYDTMIISQLAQGTLQKDIPAFLDKHDVKASSLSSVEKRLNQIKEVLGFTKNEQLVAYCKDHKII